MGDDFVAALDSFSPTDGNWFGLEPLLEQIFRREISPAEMVAMLRVFERFPEEDGTGVFWSIVHGLETLSGYEPFLVASVQRVPSDFAVIMLGRILNSGQREIGDIFIPALLGVVQASPQASAAVKRRAHDLQSRNA